MNVTFLEESENPRTWKQIGNELEKENNLAWKQPLQTALTKRVKLWTLTEVDEMTMTWK